MAIQQNFPDIKPSLNLDFANVGILDPRVTFSRASTASYYDKFGVLQTAAANTPRFDHNPATGERLGLLIEEQRTNLLLQSGWAGATTGTPGAAPTSWSLGFGSGTQTTLVFSIYGSNDGTQAVRFNVDSAERVYFSQIVSITSGVQYALSVYIESTTGNVGRPLFVSSGTATVTINSGDVNVSTAGRHTLVFTANSTGTVDIRVGVGTTATVSETVEAVFSRPQLEAGAFPTSYIPTTTAAVTRAADVAVMTGTNFSDWYNAAAGAIFTDYATMQQSSFPSVTSVSDGTNSNRIQLAHVNAARRAVVTSSGASQWDTNGGVLGSTSSGVFAKFVLTYASSNFAAVVNGGTPSAQNSGAVPIGLNRLVVGADAASVNFINGHIRRIAYYPKRLTNTQLQALTS